MPQYLKVINPCHVMFRELGSVWHRCLHTTAVCIGYPGTICQRTLFRPWT